MAKILAHDLSSGMVIEHNGSLWRVIKSTHVRVSGRGGACMQVELRGVEDATKINQRFRTDEKLERPFVETRTMQFLYADGDNFVFMDLVSFEQREISAAVLEGVEGYLLPNTEVKIAELDGRPLGVELPAAVELEVTETEPRIKGSTATATYKPATMNTGITVMVPPFIATGETIKVSTATGEYLERA